MKTLFAALATASILATPLAASAQPGDFDHHGGWQGRGGQGAPAGQPRPNNPAPQPQAQNPNQGRGQGGWQGRGGNFNRGVNNGAQAQAPQRQFGGQPQRNFGDRPQGFADRGQGRDFNRGPDFGRGPGADRRGFDNRGYAERGYADRGGWRGGYGYRGHLRPYDARFARDFRWAVGAYLPRGYWNAFIDPYAYGLDPAPWGYHWVIVDGEALLIQDGSGAIVQAFLL